MNNARGWQRQLEDGHVEVFVRSDNPRLKIRAHGSPEQMNSLLDWFEAQTGCTVNVPWRKRVGPPPLKGQLDLLQEAS